MILTILSDPQVRLKGRQYLSLLSLPLWWQLSWLHCYFHCCRYWWCWVVWWIRPACSRSSLLVLLGWWISVGGHWTEMSCMLCRIDCYNWTRISYDTRSDVAQVIGLKNKRFCGFNILFIYLLWLLHRFAY